MMEVESLLPIASDARLLGVSCPMGQELEPGHSGSPGPTAIVQRPQLAPRKTLELKKWQFLVL